MVIDLKNDVAETNSERAPEVSWLLCSNVANEQLRQALQSCLNQTFTDFELLVVANGEFANDVAAAVRSWFGADPRLQVLTTEVRHLNFSLSLGLHHARAALIARMDSDDLSRVDRLEKQVLFMRSHPEVTVLGTAYELIDDDGVSQKTVLLPLDDRAIRRALLCGNPLCHPSVMFRRVDVLAVGGYIGGIYAEDYDLWARMAIDSRGQFANLSEVCLGYRSSGEGLARGARKAYAAMGAAQFRNFVLGAGFIWGFATLLSIMKAFVRGRK